MRRVVPLHDLIRQRPDVVLEPRVGERSPNYRPEEGSDINYHAKVTFRRYILGKEKKEENVPQVIDGILRVPRRLIFRCEPAQMRSGARKRNVRWDSSPVLLVGEDLKGAFPEDAHAGFETAELYT